MVAKEHGFINLSQEQDIYLLYRKYVTWEVRFQGSDEPIIFKNGIKYFDGNQLPEPEEICNKEKLKTLEQE